MLFFLTKVVFILLPNKIPPIPKSVNTTIIKKVLLLIPRSDSTK